MSADEILVLLGGTAAAVWINWYFFFAGRAAVAAGSTGSGRQEVTVVVQGGYEPAAIRVVAGRPVKLVFDRRENSSCSEEIVIPEFGVRRFLPAGEKTTVEITPDDPGTYEFTCGMGMLRGRLIVEPVEAS